MIARIWPVIALTTFVAACSAEHPPKMTVVTGNADAGKLLIEQYGCGTCHKVPGVRQAQGTVGPPLEQFARRVYVAGELPNRPEFLVRFIQDPTTLVPGTAMPDLGVTEAQARDIGAYLYEQR